MCKFRINLNFFGVLVIVLVSIIFACSQNEKNEQ
jgi:hypothetical protein